MCSSANSPASKSKPPATVGSRGNHLAPPPPPRLRKRYTVCVALARVTARPGGSATALRIAIRERRSDLRPATIAPSKTPRSSRPEREDGNGTRSVEEGSGRCQSGRKWHSSRRRPAHLGGNFSGGDPG